MRVAGRRILEVDRLARRTVFPVGRLTLPETRIPRGSGSDIATETCLSMNEAKTNDSAGAVRRR